MYYHFVVYNFQPEASSVVIFSLTAFYLFSGFIEGVEIGREKIKYKKKFETAVCEVVGYK
jgi:hypothetical protein